LDPATASSTCSSTAGIWLVPGSQRSALDPDLAMPATVGLDYSIWPGLEQSGLIPGVRLAAA